MGESARRVVRLRVIGGHVDLRDDVPAKRADCPTKRPCGHVKCKWHLWMVAGHDRPGRRHPNGRPLQATMRLVMMEWPLPPSCALDVIEAAARDGWSQPQMARALGVKSSAFRNLLVKAREKLKAKGIKLREFFGGKTDPHGTLDPEEQ